MSLVQYVRTVQVEQVEPKWGHGQLAAHAIDVQFATKSAHGHLEWLGASIRLQTDHFAIQDQTPRRESANQFHYFRYSGGNIIQTSRIDCNLVVGLVYFNSSAVQFVFERRFSQVRQREGRISRGPGQHRLYRAKQLDIVFAETDVAFFGESASHDGDVAGKHNRAADAIQGNAGSFRQRLHHDGFQSALPQFAAQQTC